MIVAEIISKYNLVALPVVDAENVLLGIVGVDDVIDIIFRLPRNGEEGKV